MDVLISYAAADADAAESLAEALRGLGLRAARLHEPSSHPAVTARLLSEARLVVVLWSRASVLSEPVRQEAQLALARHVLVPVRLDDSMPPMGFATLHTLNLLDWDGNPAAGACRELLVQIRQRLASEDDAPDYSILPPAQGIPLPSTDGGGRAGVPPAATAPQASADPDRGATAAGGLLGSVTALGAKLGGWWGRRSATPRDLGGDVDPFSPPGRPPAKAEARPADAAPPGRGQPPGWTYAKPPERPRRDAPSRADEVGSDGGGDGGGPVDGDGGIDADADDADRPAATAAPQDAAPSPVWFGAAAPRRASTGEVFIARLATYTDATRDSAQRQLAEAGEPGDRVLSDLAPDGHAHWAPGAPVVVRLAGRHISVDPPEQRFAWNGRQHLSLFTVTVAPDAPAGALVLSFEVLLADVPMATVPMTVAISRAAASLEAPLPSTPVAAPLTALPDAGPGPAADAHQPRPAPRSLFASYASRDAAEVSARLSTLLRFAPGLDIFQDCLDLRPNEDFKPQLAREIQHRDSFVLFWSRRAAVSPWVRWEYVTARDALGLEAILPMPLEDPALAPPPPELADRHWRDRFMVAGYALKQIGQELAAAAAPAPAAAAPAASVPGAASASTPAPSA